MVTFFPKNRIGVCAWYKIEDAFFMITSARLYIMPSVKNTDHTKKTETFFGETLTMSVYAALADIDAAAKESISCTVRYPIDRYQSLENLNIEKELRDQDVSNVFTVSTESKQIFRQLYEKFVDEIKESNLTVKDTIDGVLSTTDKPILTVLNKWKTFAAPTNLLELTDKKLYLASLAMQILGSDFNRINSLVSQFVDLFHTFVKAFAYKFAIMNWHTAKRDVQNEELFNPGISMTMHYTMGILGSVFDFTVDMLEEITCELREKTKRPPKKTAAAKAEAKVAKPEAVAEQAEAKVKEPEAVAEPTTTPPTKLEELEDALE